MILITFKDIPFTVKQFIFIFNLFLICLLMKEFFCFILVILSFLFSFSQKSDTWKITADKINPQDYFGVTVANGMIGIVSSPNVLRCKDVVLNGAYDQYGRGRVSNFLQSFNLVNMNMDIDGQRINNPDAANMKQVLDMRHAGLTTTFDYKDKATISYTYYALRHLPYCVMVDVTITAKK